MSRFVRAVGTTAFGICVFSAATHTQPVTSRAASQERASAPGAGTSAHQDRDQNKLFDELDGALAAANPNDEIDVIVTFTRPVDDAEFQGVLSEAAADRARYRYRAVPGMAVRMRVAHVNGLARNPLVKQIELDKPAELFVSTANRWFGVTKATTDFGVSGDRDGCLTCYSRNDIVVAVVDTGIDAQHADLDGGKVIAWRDFVNGRTIPYDDNGHGTHVAGIAAGTGDANVSHRGVAPGAALVGLKVLDSAGSGLMSRVDAAIDWAVTNKATYNIGVLNLSLGTSGSSDGTDSTSLRVNNAAANGIVPVVAAGNSGPAAYSVGSPAAARDALTVGAMADVGERGFHQASFSSRGPTRDGRVKPDVSGPGMNITAPRANSGTGYIAYSGTSMATPFVAGVVALMQAASPQGVAAVKYNVTRSAQDWGAAGQDVEFGYGRLQAYEAIRLHAGRSGTNVTTPSHFRVSESLSGRGFSDWYTLSVTSTSYPLALTLIIPQGSASKDFDIYVYDPSGAVVAYGATANRQEQIGYLPRVTGTYWIRVYSYAGGGTYQLDTSAGASGQSISTNQ